MSVSQSRTPEPLPDRRLSGEIVSPLPPALYPARVALDGHYARVEPLDPARHAAELFATSHDVAGGERIWDFLGYGPFPDIGAFHGWLRDCSASADPMFYAIRDGRDGTARGMASYLNIHPKQGSIEIGHIWLSPSLQGTREATEALYLMLRHALDAHELGYRRLEWKCDAQNRASRGAAVRLGFAYEGIFYQHLIVKGRNRDTAWYSMLDYEWPAIRANFESWLQPENFDANGQQICSLGELNRALRPLEKRI